MPITRVERSVNTQELNDNGAENYAITRSGLGRGCDAPDNIVRLYDMANAPIGPKLVSVRDRLVLTLAIPQNVKHLVVGANSLYRLYASQMYREIRSAVEATGIACLIRKDQSKYEIFVKDRGFDKESRQAAKTAFGSRTIFPDSEPLLAALYKHFEEASMKAHTTFRGFFNHVSLKSGESTSLFSMHDIAPAAANHVVLPGHISWMCRVHLDIIEVATKLIFPNEAETTREFEQLWKETDTLIRLLSDWSHANKPA